MNYYSLCMRMIFVGTCLCTAVFFSCNPSPQAGSAATTAVPGGGMFIDARFRVIVKAADGEDLLQRLHLLMRTVRLFF